MSIFLKLYAISIATFVVLDGTWIGFIMREFYKKYIGHLFGSGMNFWAAGAFYLLYAAGLVYLVSKPGLEQNWSLTQIFLTGALVGLMAYGAYDLTNQTTIRDWPVIVTIFDMAWGAFVTGAVATIAVWVARLF
jgi:uncharacterized membrane protein